FFPGVLVGTGGTVRNLARIARADTAYPLPRLHGFALAAAELSQVRVVLEVRDADERRGVAGLSADRVDSVVARAPAVEAVMQYVQATDLIVSGQGLREGAALRAVATTDLLVGRVREAALAHLRAKFVPEGADAAMRRTAAVAGLLSAVGGTEDDE